MRVEAPMRKKNAAPDALEMKWWWFWWFMWWYSFLYMRLGDNRLRDFRVEDCETGKITITIRCLMSSSLLVSQSPCLKKGLGSLFFFPPRKIFRLRKFSKEALGLSFSLWHFYAHIISYFVIKLRKKAAGLQIIVNERCRDIRLQISDFRRLKSNV